MSEAKNVLRTSFFIATKDRGYVSSDHVVCLRVNGQNATSLDLMRGGDYYATATIEAPLEIITALFEENGYRFIRADAIDARKKSPAP